ncbi:MAG: DNA primase [Fibrobacter sp.]|nr:DNA primase [Fibrobacter sp.]
MAVHTDETVKEEIRLKADIATVIGRYVNLKGSGQTLKGLCPFHKEKTPSFHVNPSRGFYHCFGCGKGGDVFSFLQEIEGISFFDALKQLAEETGVELKQTRESDSKSPVSPFSKTTLLEIHEIAAKFFYKQIRSSKEAIEYFKSRGLKPETVRDFRLGFSPPEWSALLMHFQQFNISVPNLIAAGLAIEKEGGGAYDRFRNRVIFSLFDLSGRVIGFAGRGMEEKAVPKYLNSPETLLYKKKDVLYGLFQSRQAIKEEGFVIVVEGYMDYLTLFQAGVKNVVATSGTALTEEHAHLLQRFTSKIILIFDGDQAGQNAAERGVFILVPFNFDVRILVLPGDEDPDSYVKKFGVESFNEQVSGARTWVDFIIDKMMRQYDTRTPQGKSAVLEALQPIVQSIRDSIVLDNFKKELADRLDFGKNIKDVQLISERVGKMAPREPLYSNRWNSPVREGAGKADTNFLQTLEGSFLRILVTEPELIAEARQYVVPETLTDSTSSDIYSMLLDAFEQGENVATLVEKTSDPELKRLISLLLVSPALKDHIHDEMVQKIIHLRAKFLKKLIRQVKVQIKNEPLRRPELLRQLQDLSSQLQELDGGE